MNRSSPTSASATVVRSAGFSAAISYSPRIRAVAPDGSLRAALTNGRSMCAVRASGRWPAFLTRAPDRRFATDSRPVRRWIRIEARAFTAAGPSLASSTSHDASRAARPGSVSRSSSTRFNEDRIGAIKIACLSG